MNGGEAELAGNLKTLNLEGSEGYLLKQLVKQCLDPLFFINRPFLSAFLVCCFGLVLLLIGAQA